jgi:hypothetical protein
VKYYEVILETKTQAPKQTEGPVWLRLFRSLKIVVKPGKSSRKPIGYIGVKASVDF